MQKVKRLQALCVFIKATSYLDAKVKLDENYYPGLGNHLGAWLFSHNPHNLLQPSRPALMSTHKTCPLPSLAADAAVQMQ